MAEKLKDLLEKINKEGVQKAEEKSKNIENEAREKADTIIKEADAKAKNIIKVAESEAGKLKKSAEASIKQAARDLILSLKEEIRDILNKIISSDTSYALAADKLEPIIKKVIEKYIESEGKSSDIKVLLAEEDLKKLKKTYIDELKGRLKDGIDFRASSNIQSGFSISFDKGKSYFDFTDEGIANALSAYINEELRKIIK